MIYQSGMRLTPDRLNKTRTKVKLATQIYQSQTTLQDDNSLVFTNLPPDSIWAMDCALFYATADNADLKVGWSGTNASMSWTPTGLDSTATSATGSVNLSWISSISSTVVLGGGGGFASSGLRGVLLIGATTPGSLQFRWAQNVSQASNTQIAPPSWIRLERIS
ncbi:hypothetical protein [Micromonospora sp. NPDC004704]